MLYKMNKNASHPILKTVLRGIAIFVLAVVVFTGFYFSDCPALFKNHVSFNSEDFQFKAYALLILYRFIFYFSFPLILAFVEKIFWNKNKYVSLLIEYFNVQFGVYALISGVYYLFAIDRGLEGTVIFGSADSFLFIASFVFSLILKKKFPQNLDINEESANIDK
jgi:hypothetical protein